MKPFEYQRQTVEVTCDKHGRQQAEIYRLSKDWSLPTCPVCAASIRAEQERTELEQAQQAEKARKRKMLEARLKRSCIPPRFEQKSFADYLPQNPTAATIHRKCLAYAEQFPAMARQGTGIILCGHAGTGKTHLACAIANHVMAVHDRSAVYVQAAQAIRTVKETYAKGSGRSEQEALRWFTIPDLLILDEIGVQFGTDFERNILFEMVNARYEELKPTILISNLAMDGLMAYAGERVVDRMKENGGKLFTLEWQSYRGSAVISTPRLSVSPS
jgi:DNA replication protein DnaC